MTFLLDIVQNSFEAGSTEVLLTLEEDDILLVCTIEDNGKGMDEDLKARVLDPFVTDGVKHTKRKVGLGLPFLYRLLLLVKGASPCIPNWVGGPRSLVASTLNT